MCLIDKEKVYQLACAGCIRHGETPGECYHDEPCQRLIFAFTTAEPVDAVEVVYCKDCTRRKKGYCTIRKDSWGATLLVGEHDFCSDGERRSDND